MIIKIKCLIDTIRVSLFFRKRNSSKCRKDFEYQLIVNLSNYKLYSTNLNEKTSDIIAMLDKGIWYSLTDSKKYSKDSGSYGYPLYLFKIGYQETRYSMISDNKEMEVTLNG